MAHSHSWQCDAAELVPLRVVLSTGLRDSHHRMAASFQRARDPGDQGWSCVTFSDLALESFCQFHRVDLIYCGRGPHKEVKGQNHWEISWNLTSPHSDVCKVTFTTSELLYHVLLVPYSIAIHPPRGSGVGAGEGRED